MFHVTLMPDSNTRSLLFNNQFFICKNYSITVCLMFYMTLIWQFPNILLICLVFNVTQSPISMWPCLQTLHMILSCFVSLNPINLVCVLMPEIVFNDICSNFLIQCSVLSFPFTDRSCMLSFLLLTWSIYFYFLKHYVRV